MHGFQRWSNTSWIGEKNFGKIEIGLMEIYFCLNRRWIDEKNLAQIEAGLMKNNSQLNRSCIDEKYLQLQKKLDSWNDFFPK